MVATIGVLVRHGLRAVLRAAARSTAPTRTAGNCADLRFREGVVVASMIAVLLWLGLYPRPVTGHLRPGHEHA